ncbi:class I SAM-dependent methyltransferase [Abditibacterium utsteinense]|uniref:class I SAM-dependent methyltransferase n=1 Tax=Abditibacterium utsteinense TaxID=1960156 RepID=UPI001300369D|nr:methyltransferase [Abditibacterium utsteinense]
MSQSHYFSPQNTLSDEQLGKKSPLQVWARGRNLQFLTGDGVFSKGALDAGSRLLIETISLAPDSIFCDLGCGWGAVGAFIAKEFPNTKIYACDVNARAAHIAKRNLEGNQIEAAVWSGEGLSATRADFFTCIACNPPIRAGNLVIEKLFADAFRGLKVGGELWVVIRTAQGAKSWQKRLEAQFGTCETIVIKDGYRILKAVRGV